MVWNIWKNRNNIVFNNVSLDKEKLIQDVKFFGWFWLKNLMAVDVGTFAKWEMNMKEYLGNS